MVVLVSLFFVFLRAHPMTYLALYAALLAPPFSLLALWVFRCRLAVSEVLDADAVTKGETAEYIVTLHNRSPFPCLAGQVRLRAESAGVEPDRRVDVFPLRPWQSLEVGFSIHAKYRGRYQIGLGDLLFYDFLGLFRLRQKPPEGSVLTVLPRILAIDPLPLDATAADAARWETYRRGEDYSAISDLRQYQPTDGYQKVHWKASAKRGELISKHFEEPERLSAVFLIDTSAIEAPPEAALAREDLMMEALVSAMAAAHRQGYELSFGAPEHPDTEFTDDFSYLYSRAVDLTFGTSHDFDDCLGHHVSRREREATLLVFPQTLSARACGALETLRASGSQAILFPFDAQRDAAQIERLRQAGVHCLDFCEMRER